jgi:hypothetical protein
MKPPSFIQKLRKFDREISEASEIIERMIERLFFRITLLTAAVIEVIQLVVSCSAEFADHKKEEINRRVQPNAGAADWVTG